MYAGIFGDLQAFLAFCSQEGIDVGEDGLLGSLGCMACGPFEHFALQKAWGPLGVRLVGLQGEGNWVQNGTFDMSSCLIQSRKYSF